MRFRINILILREIYEKRVREGMNIYIYIYIYTHTHINRVVEDKDILDDEPLVLRLL